MRAGLPGQIEIRGDYYELSHGRVSYLSMKFTLDARTDRNLIRGYGPGEVRIGERVLRSNCLVGARALVESWGPQFSSELAVEHLAAIFDLAPELVLLGTGARQRFASESIRAAFLARGVALETMDLGAACRTFNILIQEERNVVAALFVSG